MTVLAAAAARLLAGTGVPVNPPKTPNGFGPDFAPVDPLPEPEPEPEPDPEPEPLPLPLPDPLLEPCDGKVEMFAKPPRPRFAIPSESCAPRSRLKFRCAITMRVSISTCGSGWSRIATSWRTASMFS